MKVWSLNKKQYSSAVKKISFKYSISKKIYKVKTVIRINSELTGRMSEMNPNKTETLSIEDKENKISRFIRKGNLSNIELLDYYPPLIGQKLSEQKKFYRRKNKK